MRRVACQRSRLPSHPARHQQHPPRRSGARKARLYGTFEALASMSKDLLKWSVASIVTRYEKVLVNVLAAEALRSQKESTE